MTKPIDHKPSSNRATLLAELCLTENDLIYMGKRQRRMVEDILSKAIDARNAA